MIADSSVFPPVPCSLFCATPLAELIRYMPRPKNKTGVNLLSADGGPVTTPKVRGAVHGAWGLPAVGCSPAMPRRLAWQGD